MNIAVEREKTTCDHCGDYDDCITVQVYFRGMKNDSIQLCKIHAKEVAEQLLEFVEGGTGDE